MRFSFDAPEQWYVGAATLMGDMYAEKDRGIRLLNM
jgi:hypothetical protein